MHSVRIAFISFVACLPFALAQAHPQTSRGQVLDELARARASGDLEVPGELGALARERRPDLYPAAQAPIRLRQAVRDEALDASRRGGTPHGDVDVVAGRAPALLDAPSDDAAGKTRAQVREELARAVRGGEVQESGDAGRQLRDIHRGRYGDMPGGVSDPRYAIAG